jgi:hypothetical protein
MQILCILHVCQTRNSAHRGTVRSDEITRIHSVARNTLLLHSYVAHINKRGRNITRGPPSQQGLNNNESVGTTVRTVKEYDVNLATSVGK